MSNNKKTQIITVASLNQYFFDSLDQINKSSTAPLPSETIYYSSEVLSQYSSADNLFEVVDGKVREKILGKKLVEALSLGEVEKTKCLKEVGDTSLVLCGYFSESVNSKILDITYYQNLGVSAYERLNKIKPEELNMPAFYAIMAQSFSILCNLISTFAAMDKSDPYDHLVFDFSDDTYTKVS